MSKIKEIQTGKCKLLAVMVPEGASDLCIPPDIYLVPTLQWWISVNGIVEEVDSVDLPDGNWQILGLSTELTEEQCRELVKSRMDIYSFPMDEEYWNYTTSRYNDQISAECAFNSLLEANQCFSVNPYGSKEYAERILNDDPFDSELYANWQEAESNTGRWLILRHVS